MAEEAVPEVVDRAKQRLFICYGRDEFQDLAARLYTDLRATGRYEVWFDREDLLPGAPWDQQISHGLDQVAAARGDGWLILLMTPHALRRPGGFCWNELRYALDRGVHILPVMVVPVEIPISINTVQWLDMTDCVPLAEHGARYQAKLVRLCAAIDTRTFPFEDPLHQLRRSLRPASYGSTAACLLTRFVERRGLVRAFDDWLADRGAPRVFWLTGPLGTGKSTLAAWLSEHRRQVKAFHACGRLDNPRADYRDAVRSVAWQLATQIPSYAERLSAIPDLGELCRDPEVDLLDRLIGRPMHGLPVPGEPVVILIDALDEASAPDVNTLAELLGREMGSLPGWIRFALTSTPDPKVSAPLQAWSPRAIDSNSDEYGEEILEFVEKHIAPLAPGGVLHPDLLAALLRASERNWLYLAWARDALEKGTLILEAMDAFPLGLGGACHCEFARRYPDRERYRGLPRSFLSVLVAARELLPVTEYARVLARDVSEVSDVVRDLAGLLVLHHGRVRPFHSALVDWLTDEARSGYHGVAALDGHHRLAEAGWAQFEQGAEGMAPYARAHLPFHLQAIGDRRRLGLFVTDARLLARCVAEEGVAGLARYWRLFDRAHLRAWSDESLARLGPARDDGGLAYRAALGTGQLFQQAGHYPDAVAAFGRALRHARRAGNEQAAAQAELAIGWCLRHAEEYARAVRYAGRALRAFRALESQADVARALSVRGICRWHLREDEAALADLHESESLFLACGDDRSRAEALNHQGIVLRSLGMFDEALSCLRQCEALSASFRDGRGLGKCLNSLGTAYWWRGDGERALECYQRADAHNEEVNQPYVLGLTANNRGYVYLEKGLFRQSLESFRRARELRRSLGTRTYEMLDLSGLALATHRLGRIREAMTHSRKAVTALWRCTAAEDLERVFFNHFTITRAGSPQERAEGRHALQRALQLVNRRRRRIAAPALRARYEAVPLVSEIIRAASGGAAGQRPPRPTRGRPPAPASSPRRPRAPGRAPTRRKSSRRHAPGAARR